MTCYIIVIMAGCRVMAQGGRRKYHKHTGAKGKESLHVVGQAMVIRLPGFLYFRKAAVLGEPRLLI